jgi:hypothetical protein
VTLIDLIGTKDLAARGDRKASYAMRGMHMLVVKQMAMALPAHSRAYIWNDSVVLLAYLDDGPDVILREVDMLKRQIDAFVKTCGCKRGSFAIAVQGRVFPEIQDAAKPTKGSGGTSRA